MARLGPHEALMSGESPTTGEPGPSRPLRVLIAGGRHQDLSRVREALSSATPAAEVAEIVRLSRLVAGVMRARPDVVLLGLGNPTDEGLEALRRLHSVAPQFPVVALACSGDEPASVAAVREGAQDCLLDDALTPRELAHAVRCAVERHRRLNALREQSWTDPLTGLHNRRGFSALAESHLQLARRNGRRVLLLCADLDDLKGINDRWGHDEGDRALTRAAELLRRSLRESDIIARFGGDEFVVLAHDADQRSAETVLARIVARFEADHAASGRPYRLSLSIGTASMDASGMSLQTLLARADESLYRAKRRRASIAPAPRAEHAAAGSAPRAGR